VICDVVVVVVVVVVVGEQHSGDESKAYIPIIAFEYRILMQSTNSFIGNTSLHCFSTGNSLQVLSGTYHELLCEVETHSNHCNRID
jgi:hypothetical protein